jgi:hypothetical protein
MVFNGSVLFSMSLQRLVLFLVVVRHWIFGADGLTVATSFINGARFDLCILGFINIPVLFITWAISTDLMVNTPNKAVQFLRKWILWVYLGVTTLAIHALGLLDMMFFAVNSHRWTYYDWQETGFSFFAKVASAWGGFFTFGVISLFVILWIVRGIFTLYKLQLNITPLKNSKFEKSKAILWAMGFVLPLFVVALSARGTWTAHHLNIEHAEVSQIQALNQMTLSPVWAFDKKF